MQKYRKKHREQRVMAHKKVYLLKKENEKVENFPGNICTKKHHN